MAPTREAKQLTVRRAARLKAEGATWDEVAVVLGYSSGNSAQHVLQRDRDLWREEYLSAINEHLAQDVEPTALQVQLDLMKLATSDDPAEKRIAEAAAHSCLLHAAKLKTYRMEVTAKREPEKADEDLMQRLIESANVAARQLVAEGKAKERERQELEEQLGELRAQAVKAGKATTAHAETPV